MLTVVSVLLFLNFVYITIFNWATIFWLNRRRTGRNVSMIPLVGGLLGAIALWIFPLYPLKQYLWMPLVVDPGFALMPLWVARALWDEYKTRRFGRN